MLIETVICDDIIFPCILFVAGLHGNENTAMECCEQLLNRIKNENIRNIHKITFINYINMYGIKNHIRNTEPIENISDLNRQWMDKSENENIREYIKNIINEDYDVIFDLHSSPNISNFFLMDSISVNNDVINFFNDKLINYAIRHSSAQTLKNYCNHKDDTYGFTYELNGLNKIDYNSVHIGVQEIMSILYNFETFFNRLVGQSLMSFKQEELLKVVYSPFEGIYKSNVKLGTFVNKDELLGVIHSKNSNLSWNIFSPCDGKLLCTSEFSYINEGEELLNIQPTIRRD